MADSIIDVRSDILGGIAPAALAAMNAAAGDAPAFEAGEDPHEAELVERVAAMFGFEAGLFVPTGTMANQIALRIFCAPGETVIAERGSHVVSNKIHSTAGLNGVAVHPVDGRRGHFTAADLTDALLRLPKSSSDRHPRLVWLENTHNRAGGTVLPAGASAAIGAVARQRGIAVHMDGARIWNALVTIGQPASGIAEGVDSLTVNFGKALGAPVGAMLLGNAAIIAEAQRERRMFGGWWRPVGFLAAAANAALSGYEARISVDGANARLLAGLLAKLPNLRELSEPQTNIVLLEPERTGSAPAILQAMQRRGVHGEGRIRLVLHARITEPDVHTAAAAIAAAIAEISVQT